MSRPPSPFGLAGQALHAARSTLGAAEHLGDILRAVLDIRDELVEIRVGLDPRMEQIEHDLSQLRRDVDTLSRDTHHIREQLDELVRLAPQPEEHSGIVRKAVDAVTGDDA